MQTKFCNSTRVYWVTQRRAKVTGEAFNKTSVTQSQHALQRSQDLGAFVTEQPLEYYTEKIWHAAPRTRLLNLWLRACNTHGSAAALSIIIQKSGRKKTAWWPKERENAKMIGLGREKDGKTGERITSCVAFSPPQSPPISLALSSSGCPITLRRIQEQGSTVLADNISSDVNGILLVFSATPEAGPSEAAVTESRIGLQPNSGVDSTRGECSLIAC